MGALLVEASLRIAGISYPSFYVTDKDLGMALRPNAEGWWRQEGEAYIRINSAGLRDREHALVKPPNTFRIAVLGDSYAEAFQVPVENTFWAVMQQKLQECRAFGGKNIEVMNFGVSGYGTAQELVMLRQRVWAYSPDLVILAVTTGNDIRNNSRPLEGDPMRPYFIIRDGRLELDSSFREYSGFRWRSSGYGRVVLAIKNHSRLAQVVSHAIGVIQSAREASRFSGANTGEIGLDNQVYVEPTDPVWKDAWNVTEALIVELRNGVQQHRARLLVVTLSSGIQVHADSGVRERFMKRLGVDNLFYPDLRIKALCGREGIDVLNLAPAMLAYAEEHHVFLHGFGDNLGGGHWNATGHRVAAEVISGMLCNAGEPR